MYNVPLASVTSQTYVMLIFIIYKHEIVIMFVSAPSYLTVSVAIERS